MKSHSRSGRVAAFCALVIVLLIGEGRAQPAGTSGRGDAAPQKFVRDYMAAVMGRDLAALKRVIHPASLACIDDTTRDFFDVLFDRELRERPISTYRLTRIGPFKGLPSSFVPAEYVRYPVTPTHEVQTGQRPSSGRSPSPTAPGWRSWSAPPPRECGCSGRDVCRRSRSIRS